MRATAQPDSPPFAASGGASLAAPVAGTRSVPASLQPLAAQTPPHPSLSPQALPLHAGVHASAHEPSLLHVVPPAHVPHDPPHPSSPQVRPRHRSAGAFPVGVPSRSVFAIPSAMDAPVQNSPTAVKPSMNAPYGAGAESMYRKSASSPSAYA